jgi:hypothetical protein
VIRLRHNKCNDTRDPTQKIESKELRAKQSKRGSRKPRRQRNEEDEEKGIFAGGISFFACMHQFPHHNAESPTKANGKSTRSE